jgi:hypothetical protein
MPVALMGRALTAIINEAFQCVAGISAPPLFNLHHKVRINGLDKWGQARIIQMKKPG